MNNTLFHTAMRFLSLGYFLLIFLSGVTPPGDGRPWGHRGGPAPRWRGPRRNRSSGPQQVSNTPLTTRAGAPGTVPVPDIDQRGTILRRQYNLVTSPLALTVPGATNAILYTAPLSPLLPLQDGTNAHIMSTEASNYAQYRVVAATLRFRPVVPASVGGYSISMSFWPQANNVPTSVDMNSITSTDVRIISQPGIATELVIPKERLHYRNQGWRGVETANVPLEESTSGQIIVAVHGSPINSYTNTSYSGPLGVLDLAVVMDYRNLTPGNTNSKVSRIKVTTKHRIQRGPRGAVLSTPAALRFMNDLDLRGNNSVGDLGGGIVGLILNVADNLLGNLPSNLLSLAGGQMLYGKPTIASNGEPALQLYGSVEQAQLDKPLQVPHDIDLGNSSVVVQDFVNNHESDRPAPAPAPKRPLGTLRTGDILFLRMQNSDYLNSSPDMGGPVYRCEKAELINVVTGVRGMMDTVDWTKATVDGEDLPRTSTGTPPYLMIPLGGKLSFWEHGKSNRAGYPYQYNNNDSGVVYVSSEGLAYTYISTYSNSLGSTGVDLACVGQVQRTAGGRRTRDLRDAKHTLNDSCPICRAVDLDKCIFSYGVVDPVDNHIYDDVYEGNEIN
ncbi:capsid protein [Bat hepatitis E virus]|uniref:Pro-secreted protein ORF2 n=1 Tax=horseshoe bat hepatitis E virus TaxID=3070190 RepID=A0AAC8RPN2_9VIRU|nr:capsid protein [Bat hepatitis E virus]AIF74286.1 capsid protein [horseshoe bat hepatitis E virus]